MVLFFQVGLVNVFPSRTTRVTHLEAITDSALDCTYLLVTGAAAAASDRTAQQARLLLEQRSTGYSWPCEQAAAAEEKGLAAAVEGLGRVGEEATGGSHAAGAARSRLSGLKQVRQ